VLTTCPNAVLDGLQPLVVAPASALLGDGHPARTAERVVAVEAFVVEKAVDGGAARAAEVVERAAADRQSAVEAYASM
jgi:hypothetical protein